MDKSAGAMGGSGLDSGGGAVRFGVLLWLAIGVLVATAGLFGAAIGAGAEASAASPSDQGLLESLAGPYRLGVGDVVSIRVWGQDELTTVVQVRPDGRISFPVVGDVTATGRTPEEVAAEIARGLVGYVRDPRVTVIVQEFRTIAVQVLGQVRVPGQYRLRWDARLVDALSAAGGPAESGDLQRVVVTRPRGASLAATRSKPASPDTGAGTAPSAAPGQPSVTADVEALLLKGDLSQNLPLSDGDVIFVPEAKKVLALGQFRAPGAYVVRNGMRILDLVAQAGGLLPSADPTAVVLTRSGPDGSRQEFPIDLEALAGDTTSPQNLLLAPGDVLAAPEAREVVVLGEVARPGAYRLRSGARLLDAIAAAGGTTPAAHLKEVSITRVASAEAGARAGAPDTVIRVDLEEALRSEGTRNNPPVLGGDLVFVPEGRRQVAVLGAVRSPGSYQLPRGSRVLDALAAAGGLAEEADRQGATLSREGAKGQPESFLLDLDRLLQEQAPELNYTLLPGDILFIPEVRRSIVVLGEVNSPGSFPYRRGMRVLDALGAAGGARPTAALDRAQLLRDPALELNLQAVIDRKAGPEENPPLTPGDVLYVPKARQQVLVLGAVARPGYYVAEPQARLLDALALAGGPTGQADLQRATLTRDGEGGPQTTRVDLRQLLEQGGGPGNLPIQGGDVIVVPEGQRQAVVLGRVRLPGAYPVGPHDRLLDLLARAGGPLEDADLAQAVFTAEPGSRPSTVDLQRLVEAGGGPGNLPLKGGEVLFVPELRRQALVLGEVARPGSFVVRKGDRLLDLIAQAGGVTDRAERQRLLLTREDGETVEIDLQRAVADPASAALNPLIQPGDGLYVPEARRQVVVLGEVRQPGAFLLQPGDRLLDAIARAGGTTDRSDPTKVSLTSASGQRRIDLQAAQADPSGPENLPLAGGDVIWVPEARNQVTVLGEVARPGAYTVRPGMRLVEVLGLAGGPTERADRAGVSITRQPEGESVPQVLRVNLGERPYEGENPVVMGGDTVYVPERLTTVVVLGEVARPGAYPVRPGMRLVEVLGLAGGPTERADRGAVSITRHPEGESVPQVLRVNLGERPYEGENPLVVGGDMVYVPERLTTVVVLGEVARPGAYPVRPGYRVLDALAAAGGLTPNADRAKLRLTRARPQGGGDPQGLQQGDEGSPVQIWSLDYDLLVAAQTGEDGGRANLEENRLLAGGDVIFVPQRIPEVTILGQVTRPGRYRIDEPKTRLLDVLAQAGGPTERADLQQATLTREGEGGPVTVTVDLERLLAEAGGPENRPVQAGDVILIPEARRQVVVLGEVARPGIYPVKPGDRLLEVLAMAGGLTDDADGSRLEVSRPGPGGEPQVTVVSYAEATKLDGGTAANLPLTGGETVVVPELNRQVLVLGEVNRPGAYSIKPGWRLLDAIALAGGLTDAAEPVIQLTRRQPDGTDRTRQVDYRALTGATTPAVAGAVTGGSGAPASNPGLNLELQGGDMLVVPRANRQVLVLGSVQRPGSFTMEPGWRVLDALAAAGGPTVGADLKNATLTRLGSASAAAPGTPGEVPSGAAGTAGAEAGSEAAPPVSYPIDLEELQATRALGQNYLLSGGDVLYVPEARQVLVLGEVQRPGSYILPRGASLLDLVAMAGGVTDDAAAGELTVTRREQDGSETVLNIDYAALVQRLSGANDPMLKPGDVVYVPQAQRQVLVLGQVARPGVYTIPAGGRLTLLGAIALAGGPQERAALQSVGIYRSGSLTGSQQVSVGRERVLFQGDAQQDPVLQGGDIVYVPETRWPDWTAIFGIIRGVRDFKDLVDSFQR